MPSNQSGSLFFLQDKAFVEGVYASVLHRNCDSAGLEESLFLLRDRGYTKEKLLLQIMHSQEAKNIQKPTLANTLKWKYYALIKIPVLGGIIQWIYTLLTLHKQLYMVQRETISNAGNLETKHLLLEEKYELLEKQLDTLSENKVSQQDFLNFQKLYRDILSQKNPFLINKNVIICSNAYPPNFIGGAELIAQYQAKELQKQGFNVTIFAGNFYGDAPHYSIRKERYDDIDVYRVKLEEKDFDAGGINFIHPKVEKHFEHLLDLLRPSIVHFHNIMGLSINLIPISKRYASKTVMTLHDTWGFCYKGTLMKNNTTLCEDFTSCAECMPHITDDKQHHIPITLRQDFIKYTLESIDIFISPSQYLKNQYTQTGFMGKNIEVLANGIDIKRFDITRKPNDTLRFTFIGYLGEHKGVKLLLQAFHMLLNKRDVHLNIVGTGTLEKELHAYVKTNKLSECITFKGKVDNTDIPNVFTETDVYILPSICAENQPVSITEAFASKVPVIGTDLGGIKELVIHKERGLLFPIGDQEALSASMQYCIDNPREIEKYGINAYNFMKNKSFEKQVKRLILHYHAPTVPVQTKSYIIACIGNAFSQECIAIMDAIRAKHSAVYFVRIDWLSQPLDCNILISAGNHTEENVEIFENYTYLQKPILLNESYKNSIISNNNLALIHSDMQRAIEDILEK